MVQRRLRSRSKKKIKRRTPEGRVAVHYRKRRPGLPKCSRCGRQLPGLKAHRPGTLKGVSRSKKRVNRPYGGNLCSACMRSVIKLRAREGRPEA